MYVEKKAHSYYKLQNMQGGKKFTLNITNGSLTPIYVEDDGV